MSTLAEQLWYQNRPLLPKAQRLFWNKVQLNPERRSHSFGGAEPDLASQQVNQLF